MTNLSDYFVLSDSLCAITKYDLFVDSSGLMPLNTDHARMMDPLTLQLDRYPPLVMNFSIRATIAGGQTSFKDVELYKVCGTEIVQINVKEFYFKEMMEAGKYLEIEDGMYLSGQLKSSDPTCYIT